MYHACQLDIATLEKPTTLDEALECFAQIKDALVEMEERVREAECRAECADDDVDEAESQAEEAEFDRDECVRALACVLQKLKAGRTAEA